MQMVHLPQPSLARRNSQQTTSMCWPCLVHMRLFPSRLLCHPNSEWRTLHQHCCRIPFLNYTQASSFPRLSSGVHDSMREAPIASASPTTGTRGCCAEPIRGFWGLAFICSLHGLSSWLHFVELGVFSDNSCFSSSSRLFKDQLCVREQITALCF